MLYQTGYLSLLQLQAFMSKMRNLPSYPSFQNRPLTRGRQLGKLHYPDLTSPSLKLVSYTGYSFALALSIETVPVVTFAFKQEWRLRLRQNQQLDECRLKCGGSVAGLKG